MRSLEDVIMDEVDDLKIWLQKKEGEPLALSYKLNVGILNVLWSVTCGRWGIYYLLELETKVKPRFTKVCIVSYSRPSLTIIVSAS